MNSSKDLLNGIELIKQTGKDAGWSDEMIVQHIRSYLSDWQGRRHSDLLKRHE